MTSLPAERDRGPNVDLLGASAARPDIGPRDVQDNVRICEFSSDPFVFYSFVPYTAQTIPAVKGTDFASNSPSRVSKLAICSPVLAFKIDRPR